ncbi:MAG: tetraacyldisaccharide 4'-kinase [Bacteroidia bacterium]
MHIALRIILSPLAPFWWLFAVAKRWIYAASIKKRYQSGLTTLVVGNLSMGGTGKTPFSIFLIEQLLKRNIQVAYLSRGYGRKTKGLIKVENESTPEQVGDEALMVKMRFPAIDVVVCENRKEGLQFVESSSLSRVVIMDDAFQHLRIMADHYFLLTTYEKPFFKDYIYPIGDLREPRFFAATAETIVVTKTPPNVSPREKLNINEAQKKLSKRESRFTSVKSSNNLFSVYESKKLNIERKKVVGFSGIAHAAGFRFMLNDSFQLVDFVEFGDHHEYHESDFRQIASAFEKKGSIELLITTEKDAARLQTSKAKKALGHLPLFYWPIQLETSHELNAEINHIIENKCLNR